MQRVDEIGVVEVDAVAEAEAQDALVEILRGGGLAELHRRKIFARARDAYAVNEVGDVDLTGAVDDLGGLAGGIGGGGGGRVVYALVLALFLLRACEVAVIAVGVDEELVGAGVDGDSDGLGVGTKCYCIREGLRRSVVRNAPGAKEKGSVGMRKTGVDFHVGQEILTFNEIARVLLVDQTG